MNMYLVIKRIGRHTAQQAIDFYAICSLQHKAVQSIVIGENPASLYHAIASVRVPLKSTASTRALPVTGRCRPYGPRLTDVYVGQPRALGSYRSVSLLYRLRLGPEDTGFRATANCYGSDVCQRWVGDVLCFMWMLCTRQIQLFITSSICVLISAFSMTWCDFRSML